MVYQDPRTLYKYGRLRDISKLHAPLGFESCPFPRQPNRLTSNERSRSIASGLEVDVREDEDAYVILLQLPLGLSKDRLIIELEKNSTLVVRERGLKASGFRRDFRLPNNIDTNNISATMYLSVLKIIVPKKQMKMLKQNFLLNQGSGTHLWNDSDAGFPNQGSGTHVWNDIDDWLPEVIDLASGTSQPSRPASVPQRFGHYVPGMIDSVPISRYLAKPIQNFGSRGIHGVQLRRPTGTPHLLEDLAGDDILRHPAKTNVAAHLPAFVADPFIDVVVPNGCRTKATHPFDRIARQVSTDSTVRSNAACKNQNLTDFSTVDAGAPSVHIPLQSLLDLIARATRYEPEGRVQWPQMLTLAEQPGKHYPHNGHLPLAREKVGSDAAFKYKNLLDCTNSNAGASSVRLPMQSLLSLLNQTTTSGQEGAVQCQEMSSSAQEPGMQYQDNSHLAQPREKNTITRTAKDSSSADVPCFTGAAGAKNISLDGDSQAKGSSSTAPEVYVISRDGSIRKVDQGEGVASKAGAENDCTQGSVPKWTEGSKFVIFVPDDSTCPTDEPVQCIYKALSDGRSRKPNWCTRKPLVPENTNKPLMREDTFKEDLIRSFYPVTDQCPPVADCNQVSSSGKSDWNSALNSEPSGQLPETAPRQIVIDGGDETDRAVNIFIQPGAQSAPETEESRSTSPWEDLASFLCKLQSEGVEGQMLKSVLSSDRENDEVSDAPNNEAANEREGTGATDGTLTSIMDQETTNASGPSSSSHHSKELSSSTTHEEGTVDADGSWVDISYEEQKDTSAGKAPQNGCILEVVEGPTGVCPPCTEPSV